MAEALATEWELKSPKGLGHASTSAAAQSSQSQIERLAEQSSSEQEPVVDPDIGAAERVIAGDHDAFAEIVRRHQRGLFFLVRRYVKDDDEAKDVVQTTFVRAYRALGEFRAESALKSWLYRIAVNAALSRLRDSRANLRESLDDMTADRVESSEFATNRAVSPLADLVSGEQKEAVRAALDTLPEKQRLVVELRVYRDLSFKEVAEIAECSENAAKVNFHHAVKRLRNALRSGESHESDE